MITDTDISIVYSDGQIGGSGTNCLPQNSLGGDPSNCPVTTTINNLFESLTTEQTQEGRIDYRCFYIFNDSLTEDLPNSSIFFNNQYNAPAQLQIGVNTFDDVQKITIATSPVSGTIKITFDAVETSAITLGGSISTNQTNIANALNALASLSGVTVLGADFGTYQTYTLTFSGADGNRFQPQVSVSNNSLSGSPSITVQKSVNGSPINTVAPVVVSGLNAPAGINFYSTDPDNRKIIGTLKSGEGFPIWIKRVVPSGSNPSDLAGAVFRFQGLPF